MKRPRDSQKTKLYLAERQALGSPPDANGLCHREEWTLRQCEEFVAKVFGDPWFNQTFRTRLKRASGKPPDVFDGRGARIARGGWSYLKLPRWSRNPCVVLHEIAHAAEPWGAREASHGREFAQRFLLLVQHYMGHASARRLRLAFRQHRVKYLPKRRLTAAALVRLRARGRALAAAHFPPYRPPKEG